jgi:hypothetical protein
MLDPIEAADAIAGASAIAAAVRNFFIVVAACRRG